MSENASRSIKKKVVASSEPLRYQLWAQISVTPGNCSAGPLRLTDSPEDKEHWPNQNFKKWFDLFRLKQTGKERRTVFQYEVLPYSPLPFPLINHFNQIKCHVVFRLVFFVLLYQNIRVNILVKHSLRGNSKQIILTFSQKCLLLTNHLLTSVHNQILTDLNLHFSRSAIFKQKSVQPWTGSFSLASWMRSVPSFPNI